MESDAHSSTLPVPPPATIAATTTTASGTLSTEVSSSLSVTNI